MWEMINEPQNGEKAEKPKSMVINDIRGAGTTRSGPYFRLGGWLAVQHLVPFSGARKLSRRKPVFSEWR